MGLQNNFFIFGDVLFSYFAWQIINIILQELLWILGHLIWVKDALNRLMHIRRTLARAVHFMGRVPHCLGYCRNMLWMFGLDRMPGSDLLNSTQTHPKFQWPSDLWPSWCFPSNVRPYPADVELDAKETPQSPPRLGSVTRSCCGVDHVGHWKGTQFAGKREAASCTKHRVASSSEKWGIWKDERWKRICHILQIRKGPGNPRNTIICVVSHCVLLCF